MNSTKKSKTNLKAKMDRTRERSPFTNCVMFVWNQMLASVYIVRFTVAANT